MRPVVHGRVATGYELVVERFREVIADGTSSADCCVYVDNERVVDLRAGRSADNVQCIFSATKGAVAACANLLIERGDLDPDAPVTRYWPEFGAHGKEGTTVRDLLEHRAGVLAPDSPLDVEQLGDWNAVCTALAAAAPAWQPGRGAYGYHAQSFGWLVGELIRRVDGRELVDFFAAEIGETSGANIMLGLLDSQASRLLDVAPAEQASAPEAGDADLSQFVSPYTNRAMTLGGALPEDAFAIQSDPRLRRLPIAATNGYANAVGLARMYAWLLTEYSPHTQCELTSTHTTGPDLVLSSPACDIEQHFSRGFEVIQPITGSIAFGHHGLGGTTAYADPIHHLAFAFTTTVAIVGPPGLDSRAQTLAAAVHESLAQSSNSAERSTDASSE
jgi:CubicO group peptidase (beta-lactamase class C family)